MVPAHPPLPTAWNLPFQPDAGIQASILMSESLDGFSVAATQQNAGRLRNAATGRAAVPPAGAGGMNAPASTTFASVIVAVGSVSDARLSHDLAPVASSSPFTAAALSVAATRIVVIM